MCHTFLEFDFNENLNMVIGNNGSRIKFIDLLEIISLI